MEKYNDEELQNLKNKIENLSRENHVEIFKILKENEVTFSENSNGIFINISELDKVIIDKLKEYVEYYYNQEHILNKAEKEKEKYKQNFFE
jgi:hypothetical protein